MKKLESYFDCIDKSGPKVRERGCPYEDGHMFESKLAGN
jgi:hypothetical protein